MILYHIADLHLGKSIYGRSMLEDQRDWIDKFLDKCDEGRPDAVLIAGDVYDRSNPSGEAMELMGYFLSSLDEKNITVFMIAGNHDGGERVEYLSAVLEKQNIHVAGKVTEEIRHYTAEDPDGLGPVTFWLVPYIFPEKISTLFEDESIKNYNDAMSCYLGKQEIDTSRRNVILSHQNVTDNGKEIERGGSETMVGGVGQIEYRVFDAFDYAALGHIHSGLKVGRPEVRYAGTPLCYHFDETRYEKKGFVKVILGAKGEEIQTETVQIEPLHRMRYILGSQSEVYDQVKDTVGEGDYVGIVINDKRLNADMSSYLTSLVEEKGAILLYKNSTYVESVNRGAQTDTKSLEDKKVEDLFSDFYRAQMGDQPPSDEEYALLTFVGELVRNSHGAENEKDVNIDKILNELLKEDGGEE